MHWYWAGQILTKDGINNGRVGKSRTHILDVGFGAAPFCSAGLV